MTARSKILNVQSLDINDVDSRDVSQGSCQGLSLVVDDNQRSFLNSVLFASGLGNSASEGFSVDDSLDVLVAAESLKDLDDLFGLLDLVDLGVEDKWELRDLVDLVASGLDQWKDSSGSNSGGQGVSSHSQVDFSVPSSVGDDWEGHSSLSDHVTEGGLSVSAGTRAGDSWNSGDGSSGSPGFGRVSHTCVSVDSVGLSGVLGQVVVDVLDDVLSQGAGEDIWKFDLLQDVLLVVVVVD